MSNLVRVVRKGCRNRNGSDLQLVSSSPEEEQTKKEQGSSDPCSGYLNRFETARLEHKRALRRRITWKHKDIRSKVSDISSVYGTTIVHITQVSERNRAGATGVDV